MPGIIDCIVKLKSSLTDNKDLLQWVDSRFNQHDLQNRLDKLIASGKHPLEADRIVRNEIVKETHDKLGEDLSDIKRKVNPKFKEPKKVSEKTPDTSTIEKKYEDKKSVMAKARAIEDVTEPRDVVLQHFASGGKINPSAIGEIFGGKNEKIRQSASTESEKRKRIGLIGTNAPSIDELAHTLWESDKTGKYTTEQYKEAIEDVITSHDSSGSMAKELTNKYLQKGVRENLSDEEKKQYDDIQIAKRAEQVEGLPEDQQKDLIDLLGKYQDQYGNIDWTKMENDSNGFDTEMLSLPEDTQRSLYELIEKNINAERQSEPDNATDQNGIGKEEKDAGEIPGQTKKGAVVIQPGEISKPNIVPLKSGSDQAAPPEEPPQGGGSTQSGSSQPNNVGVSHKSLNELADRIGLAPIPRGVRLTPKEFTERGRRLLNAGASVSQIEMDFKNGKQPDKDDISVARAHLEDLEKERNRIGDDKTLGKNSAAYQKAEQEVDRWAREVVKPMGTRISEPFTALQGVTDIDTGSFTAISNAKADVTGKAATELPREIRELSNKVKILDEANQRLENELKAALDRAMSAEKMAGKGKYAQKAKQAADYFRKLKTKPFKFKDENGNEHDLTALGVTWNDIVELGAKAIEKTGDIADGIAAVIDKIKDTDWYGKFSDSDKNNFRDQLERHYMDTSAEGKNILRLQKQLEDLQSGNARQQSPRREYSQEEKDLQEQIFEAKKNLGLVKSKDISPTDKRDISEKETEDLVTRFTGKKDNRFTQADSKDIWDYAKKTYMDHNPNFKIRDVVNKIAIDLGLSPEQVRNALGTTPETRKISDKIYRNQHERNKAHTTITRWVNKDKDSEVNKLFDTVAAPFRSLATLGHGHALLFTHAGMNLFDPTVARKFFQLCGSQFKIVYGKPELYEKAVNDLKNDPLYTTALRAQLGVDPDTIYDDWQLANNFLKKLGVQGNKGFLILKMMRMEVFKSEYNKLSAIEKADDETVKSIAQIANSWTGTAGLKVSPAANAFIFAPNLIVSKFIRLTTDPARALITLGKMAIHKDVSIADKAATRIILIKSGRIAGMYIGALVANQAMLSLTGSDQTINFFHPLKSDWLKFKTGLGNTVDVSSGIVGTMQFLTQLGALPFESNKDTKEDYYGAASPQDALKNEVFGFGRRMLSPFGSTVMDIAAHKDFEGNVLPMYSDKPGKGKENLSWGFYLSQKLPIPVADAFRTVHDQMRDEGVSEVTTRAVLVGILQGSVASGGIKVGNEPKPPDESGRKERKEGMERKERK